jgi:hypothetical protein
MTKSTIAAALVAAAAVAVFALPAHAQETKMLAKVPLRRCRPTGRS